MGCALVFATASCGETLSVSSKSLRATPEEKLDVVLTDKTQLRMYDAHLGHDDVIRGIVTACEGASCTAARTRGVQLARVETMTKWDPDGAGTALAVGGTALVGLGLIALVIGLATQSTLSLHMGGGW